MQFIINTAAKNQFFLNSVKFKPVNLSSNLQAKIYGKFLSLLLHSSFKKHSLQFGFTALQV